MNTGRRRQYSLLLAASALAVISSSPGGGALAGTDLTLERAIAYFNQGDYRHCMIILEEACDKQLSRNATAHYYLANALVKMERRDQAFIEYEMAAALGKGTKLESLARMGADTLAMARARANPGSSMATANPAATHLPTEKSATPTPRTTVSPPTRGNAAREAQSIIEHSDTQGLPIAYVRHTNDTDGVVLQVDEALKKVPTGLTHDLKVGGIKVLITPSMLEADPSLATETPRGYVHGGGYTNCAAMFRPGKKTIYISERVSWLSNLPQVNDQVSAAMLHEMGHAVDYIRSNISASMGFASTYKRDADKQSNTQRAKFQYYTQEGDAGACELFAQLFSLAIDPSLLNQQHNRELADSFPGSFLYIKSTLK